MKARLLCGALLCFVPLLVNAKTPLTIDPLTKLPLYPAAATGPDPVHMPTGNVCKSKFEGDFYSIDTPLVQRGVKLDATLAWCVANLKGFKHAHGNDCDAFYNAAGTQVVIVMGSSGDKNADTESVTYQSYTPGLAEKTIFGLTEGKMVCP